MYKKIPRRLRYVQKDSEKITVCTKRFREDYGIYYHQERGSHDDDDDDDDFISWWQRSSTSWYRRSSIGAFILSPDDDVHLSVRSSYLLMTTFICRGVHLSISSWRRSLSLNVFRYTIDEVPHRGSSCWTRCSHQRLHLNGSFERRPFFFVCCCRWCGFAVGSLCLRRFCFLLGLALCCWCSFFERGFQEDSSGSSRINNCNVFSTTSSLS